MKRLIFAAMAFVALDASAQSSGTSSGSIPSGYYMPVGRSNDPFVFCTEGVPEHGWVAVNPISGTWTPISQYVNYQWIATYVAICPKAYGQGGWEGPGTGSMVPFYH